MKGVNKGARHPGEGRDPVRKPDFKNHVNSLDSGLRRNDGLVGQLYHGLNRYLFVFFSVLTLLGSPLVAQDKKNAQEKSVSISAVLEIAREENPAIEAARKNWEAAKEKIPQARSFPDPVLSFVTFKEELQTRAGPLEEKYAISQKFLFFGKRGLKGKIAGQNALVSEQAYKSKSLEIFSKVAWAYYELFYIDQSIKVNEELADQVRHFARVAERKYATGNQSQTSVFRAQVELAKVLNDLITLHQERISALARLNALLDRPSRESLLPEGPKDFTFEPKVDDLIKAAKRYRPEILAAQAMVGKGKAAASLTIRQYFPDLILGYEMSKIGAGTTNMSFDGKDAKALSLKINVPLWHNRLAPQVREAKARVASAEALLEDWTNRTIFEVEDLVVKIETAGRLVKLFNDTVLPQAEQALKSSRSGYEADRVRFLDLLDSIRMLLKFELDYYRYEANFEQAKAKLERVLGVPIASVNKLVRGDSNE